MVDLLSLCQERPNGNTGQDHQYQGLSQDALGNVTTLLSPHGTRHLSRRSRSNREKQWYGTLNQNDIMSKL